MCSVQSSGFVNGRNGFQAYAIAATQMICGDLFDGRRQGGDFGATYFQDDRGVLANGQSNVEEFIQSMGVETVDTG